MEVDFLWSKMFDVECLTAPKRGAFTIGRNYPVYGTTSGTRLDTGETSYELLVTDDKMNQVFVDGHHFK